MRCAEILLLRLCGARFAPVALLDAGAEAVDDVRVGGSVIVDDELLADDAV